MEYLSTFLTSSRIKVFIISFIAAFLMVVLPKLGFNLFNFQIISPLPQHIDNFDKILTHLEQKPNDFHLKNSNGLITQAKAAGDFDQASAYGVINLENGDILLEKNLSKPLPIASLTKIMTAVVTLDLMNPEELVTVSPHATTMIPSKVFLKSGDKLTVRELLTCFLLSSANDCAEAVKDGVNAKYGQDGFIKAMNAKAQFLGLKNTHFQNAEGFDSRSHFSSVEDLSLLSEYALKNYPLISEIAKQPSSELLENQTHKYFYLNNWNGLIGVYPGIFGLKIGNTDDAGYTTIVASERGDKRLLVVLLGAPGIVERDLWAAQLLDQGFSHFNLPEISISKADLKTKYLSWKY